MTTTISKPTVNDIARHAGVSLATVDRVLNARPGVRQVTRERVNKAIAELGYVRDTAAANLARNRVYHFTFVFPDSASEFYDSLEAQIHSQSDALSNQRTLLNIKRTQAYNSRSVVIALDELISQGVDGIAVNAPETPAVRDAIDRARKAGIVVVALISDLPSSLRDHFIGIDNSSAGQTAAQLMGRFIDVNSGYILFLTSARLARDHLERRHGFDSVMSTHFPRFKVLPTIEVRNDEELVDSLLPNVFETWNEIRGIYASLSSNRGLIEYLAQSNINPVVIAHELTPASRSGLQQGVFDALISQDTGHIVRSAVQLMRTTVESVTHSAPQERIGIDIFLKENLPSL